MPKIDKISWEILNALADDAENIEQVYLAVAFEFGDDQAYRRVVPSITLEAIADRLTAMIEAGYVTVTVADLWRGWLQMTSAGRALWQAMTPAPATIGQ